jgi:quinol monooxygenase YgiN
MTVIAIGRVYGVASARGRLRELMARSASAARAEPGCRSFHFAEVVDGADEFVVVHEWDDESALEAHYRGAVHHTYQQGLFGLLARPSELAIHHVASTQRPTDGGPMDPRQAD